MNEKFEKNKKIEIFLKKYLHFRKRWCILNESTAKSKRQINKWPVGQGVKTCLLYTSRFFVDFEGNLKDSAVKNALRGIEAEADRMRILGNY